VACNVGGGNWGKNSNLVPEMGCDIKYPTKLSTLHTQHAAICLYVCMYDLYDGRPSKTVRTSHLLASCDLYQCVINTNEIK